MSTWNFDNGRQGPTYHRHGRMMFLGRTLRRDHIRKGLLSLGPDHTISYSSG